MIIRSAGREVLRRCPKILSDGAEMRCAGTVI